MVGPHEAVLHLFSPLNGLSLNRCITRNSDIEVATCLLSRNHATRNDIEISGLFSVDHHEPRKRVYYSRRAGVPIEFVGAGVVEAALVSIFCFRDRFGGAP
jgi:hypothetical protein